MGALVLSASRRGGQRVGEAGKLFKQFHCVVPGTVN